MKLFICLVTIIAIAQGCVLPRWSSNAKLLTYDEITECIESIPFSSDLRTSTLDSIRRMVKLYAFRDIVANSPTEGFVPINVDISSELNRIESASYANDYQFQLDLNSVFNRLRDPHTLYSKPSACYDFSIVQPFTLTSSINQNGDQIITVNGLRNFASAWSNLNPSQYVGKEVKSINGMNPLQVITDFVMSDGWISKDKGTMFNYALNSQFLQRDLLYNGFPTEDSLTWNLDGQTVTIPWLAYNHNNANMTITNDCNLTPPVTKRSTENREDFQSFIRKGGESHQPFERLRLLKDRDNKSHRMTNTLNRLSTSASAQIYQLDDSPIFIARVLDFLTPYSQQSSFLNQFIRLNAKATETSPDSTLILDLRENGGGDVCLGFNMIQVLTGESDLSVVYDIIHAPINDQIMPLLTASKYQTSELFTPTFWIDPSTGQSYTDISWYSPGETHTRGGKTSTYSKRSTFDCGTVKGATFHKWKEIVIVSDGTCGSICAVIALVLAKSENVKVLTYGGLAGKPLSYSAYPGGAVFGISDMRYYVDELQMNLNASEIPVYFTNTAYFRVTYLEAYHSGSDNNALPMEFIAEFSDIHLDKWGFETDEELYDAVAEHIDTLSSSNRLHVTFGMVFFFYLAIVFYL